MSTTKKYVSLDKLGLYDEKIKKVISDGDAASLQSAKDYADGLAVNYEPAGTAATEAGKVQTKLDEEVTRAKGEEARIEGLVTTAQGEVDALEVVVAGKAAQTDLDALVGKVGEVPEDQTVMEIITNIQENAYDDTAIVERISAVEENKADKTKVADIENAVNNEVAARERFEEFQTMLNGTYLGYINDNVSAIELKADKTALDSVSAVANAAVKQSDYDTKVKALEDEDARIVGLVEDEAERAAGVEAGLEGRIETMEAFWEAAKADGTDSNVIDTLKEIQDYITGDETGASEMLASIKQNSDDIDALETAVAKKAEQTALDAEVTARTQADSALDTRLKLVESAVGESGSVATDIADAKSEAISEATATAAADATSKVNKALDDAKKYADNADNEIKTRVDTLEAASATHAKQTDLTALTTRVTTSEGEIDTLQTEMDAVQALADAADKAAKANAAAIALKASQADLDSLEARVDAVELWQENMVECTETDINDLFVAQ